ncbi:MAG: AarF/UbiB family protein [Deltaproteobacteria bacterium]|nr:AarF/UbiB family protein [Deltaproteobacteria bacterium]
MGSDDGTYRRHQDGPGRRDEGPRDRSQGNRHDWSAVVFASADGLRPFHADPHPGNTIVMYDGRVSLVDFGIIGYLDEEAMLQIASIFLGFRRTRLRPDHAGIRRCRRSHQSGMTLTCAASAPI